MSVGQWQKLALARGFMRDEPLLLVLDEPTAALDAETEHALFERYASAARGSGNAASDGNGSANPGGDGNAAAVLTRERTGVASNRTAGRITLLVSHRFSTVRMADLIVVLDGARVVEVGSHEELMAKAGHYAESVRDPGRSVPIVSPATPHGFAFGGGGGAGFGLGGGFGARGGGGWPMLCLTFTSQVRLPCGCDSAGERVRFGLFEALRQ